MKKSVIYFIISSFIGLGLGYVMFDVPGVTDNAIEAKTSPQAHTDTEKPAANPEPTTGSAAASNTTTGSVDTAIFKDKGCIGCHSISGLNLTGGATGPDLSQAYNNVEGKHGKPINEFLKAPTSAVMSGVIGGKPLSDEEIAKITDLLKQAAQAK